MGPSVAQDIVETFLPYKTSEESYVTEDIHFIESRLEDYHSRLTGLAAELDTLRRYHRQTLQDLPMGVCSLAKDQEVLMWNRAIEELTGVGAQKVVGSRLSALPEPWKGLLERFIDAPDEHLHKQRLVYDGHTRWLNLHKAAIEEPLAPGNSGLVLLVEDLTETQLLEDKLVHSERLASIGRLAAGVAHEIGNPITGIACLAQNLREEREGDGELTEISEQILDQTKRVSRIVQSLMSFAHSGSHLQALEPVCLSEVAQEAIGLLSLNRRSVEVEFFNLCDPAHWVEGDSQRLAQVLINLLSMLATPARRAARSGSAAKPRNIPWTWSSRTRAAASRRRSWTSCSNRSSPPRTPARDRARPRTGLFDRGRALWTDNHREPDGSPARRRHPLPRDPAAAPWPDGRAVDEHVERAEYMAHILIVEDETIIRSALRRLLERNQYQVSEAGSVQEAQERYTIPPSTWWSATCACRAPRHRTDQARRRHSGADHDQLRQPAFGGGFDEDGRGGLHRQAFRPRRNAPGRGAHPRTARRTAARPRSPPTAARPAASAAPARRQPTAR